MYSYKLVKHNDADASVFNRVIALKQNAWPYPRESQLAWMKENLKDDDIHVILTQDDKDVAYLNMVNVNCLINGVNSRCAGIGNVCSSEVGGAKTFFCAPICILKKTNCLDSCSAGIQ